MRGGKPSYYSRLPAAVRYDRGLSPGEKLLYSELSALCSKTGCCWAGNPYFAKLYGVSRRTVQRWLCGLLEKGYVRIAGRTSSRKIYLSAWDKNVPELGTKMSPRIIQEIENGGRIP